MADVSIQFPQRDVDNLMRAMERQSHSLGIPMREATQNAAKLVAYSAAAATKESKQYRLYSARSEKSKSGKKMYNVKSAKKKKFFPVYANSVKELKQDRRVIIARRGLAKKAWQIIGAQIPGSYGAVPGKSNASPKTKQRAIKFGNVKINRNPLNPSVTLTNSLDYGMAAIKGGTGALDSIVGKAARRMFRLTNAAVRKEMQAA